MSEFIDPQDLVGSAGSRMYHHDDDEGGLARHGYHSVSRDSAEHELNVTDSSIGTEASGAKSHMYGSFVGYCFTVNYILGVGVLGMPYAFYKVREH
jgi:hypothetical protein